MFRCARVVRLCHKPKLPTESLINPKISKIGFKSLCANKNSITLSVSTRLFSSSNVINNTSPSEVSETLLPLTEQSFYSQGLGFANGTPPGVIQGLLEQIHIGLDIPWWGTIITATVIMRICVLPLVIKARKGTIRGANAAPITNEFNKIIGDSSLSMEKRLKAKSDYMKFANENNINPIYTGIPLLCNGAIFMSMFFALRGMAELPVESMKTGGTLWFTDLTSMDPYFLLPVITCTSLIIHMKVGGDGQSLDSLPKGMQNFFYTLPILSIPVMCYFPTALNLYWLTSNIFTITSSRILSIESVRKALDIPKIDPEAQKQQQEQWKMMKEEFSKLNEMNKSKGIQAKIEERLQEHVKEIQKRQKEEKLNKTKKK